MSEQWKLRLALRGEFGRGFWVGFIVPCLAALLINYFALRATTALERVANLREQEAKEYKSAAEEWKRVADSCAAKFDQATVLYEFEPSKGIEVLHGLVEIRPGQALGGPQAFGKSKMRWYIPAKVTPIVYGQPKGVAYSWYNPAQKKFEGPFVPEIVAHE